MREQLPFVAKGQKEKGGLRECAQSLVRLDAQRRTAVCETQIASPHHQHTISHRAAYGEPESRDLSLSKSRGRPVSISSWFPLSLLTPFVLEAICRSSRRFSAGRELGSKSALHLAQPATQQASWSGSSAKSSQGGAASCPQTHAASTAGYIFPLVTKVYSVRAPSYAGAPVPHENETA